MKCVRCGVYGLGGYVGWCSRQVGVNFRPADTYAILFRDF